MSPRKRRVVRQKPKGAVDPRFGQRLRELRTARGMTQAQLAGADFSKGFVSLVETGRARVSLRAAQIFADRLGLPLGDLVDPAPARDGALRLRALLSQAARVEMALADAERVRRELAEARAAIERGLDQEPGAP